MYLFQPERYLLQKQVKKASPHIRGRVLDVGSGTFARYKRLFQFSEYVTMDIQESERVDVVGSADQIPFPDNSFDSLISTQVLGDIMDPQKAVSEFHRVLKKGGTAVITESFINEMHDEPYDYWRFTRYG
ncbi:MAG: class I SAM-dependent methyltransferase, partial [Patescibacteria group bacterium]